MHPYKGLYIAGLALVFYVCATWLIVHKYSIDSTNSHVAHTNASLLLRLYTATKNIDKNLSILHDKKIAQAQAEQVQVKTKQAAAKPQIIAKAPTPTKVATNSPNIGQITQSSAPSTPTKQEANSSLSYVNNLRSAAGKPPLQLNATLNQWALSHTITQAQQCDMHHQNIQQFLGKQIGVQVHSIAENVGHGTYLEDVLEALRYSPGHYANMTGDFTYIGIGVVVASSGSCTGEVFTTQLFAK